MKIKIKKKQKKEKEKKEIQKRNKWNLKYQTYILMTLKKYYSIKKIFNFADFFILSIFWYIFILWILNRGLFLFSLLWVKFWKEIWNSYMLCLYTIWFFKILIHMRLFCMLICIMTPFLTRMASFSYLWLCHVLCPHCDILYTS